MEAGEYIQVDLDNEQKKAIVKYASIFLRDEITRGDLANVRKKWIRFAPHELTEIIGELSFHFNRCKKGPLFYFLDELIDHLESHEERFR